MAPSLQPLDSLKGFPAQIRPVLECVGSVQDLLPNIQWVALKRCLQTKLLALPARFDERRVSNLISAQALPTAVRLGLIRKVQGVWRLTYYGNRSLEVVGDSERLGLRLGKIILEIDSEKWHVIDALKACEAFPSQKVSMVSLMLSLAALGIDAMEGLSVVSEEERHRLDKAGVTWRRGSSRLSDLLQFYNWVNIVRTDREGITLLHSRLGDIFAEEIERPPGSIPLSRFFQILEKEYDALALHVYRNPFVPITGRLMESVCKRLQIGEREFSRQLLRLPANFQNRQILLSPYRRPKPKDEVIIAGERQYYFISMYTAEGESRRF